MGKPKVKSKDTFKKGTVVGVDEVLTIINENRETVTMELKDIGMLTDNSEFMTVTINIKK